MAHFFSDWFNRFYNFIDTHYPPLPKWSVRDIPDLNNKVVLVTGVTIGGIGFEIAKVLSFQFPDARLSQLSAVGVPLQECSSLYRREESG